MRTSAAEEHSKKRKSTTTTPTAKNVPDSPTPIRTRSQHSNIKSDSKVVKVEPTEKEEKETTNIMKSMRSTSRRRNQSQPAKLTKNEEVTEAITPSTDCNSIQAICSPRKTRSVRRRQEVEGDFEGQLKCLHCHGFEPLDNLKECPKCMSPFHLMKCLKFSPETLEYLDANPNRWACPRCICCAAKNCGDFIAGPNRQCARCSRAWHIDCLKKNCDPGEFPFTEWFCQTCTGIRLAENPKLERKVTPPSKNQPNENPKSDWRHKQKPNSTVKRGSRIQYSGGRMTSPIPLKLNKNGIGENSFGEDEVVKRRMTRSNAVKEELVELDENFGMRKIASSNVKNELLKIEEKLDMKAVQKREIARIRHHRGMEEEEEEEDEDEDEMVDLKNLKIGSHKNPQQQNKQTSNLTNSPKTSKGLKERREIEGFYEEQMRVLSEMGFNPEETGANRNSQNHWLQFGQFVRFRPLYESAYAQSIQSAPIIYVCEFCLTPMAELEHFRNHVWFCPRQYPPGNEIYRNAGEGWNIFEVEGYLEPNYCRNLCLMAKLFLSSKTLYHEVETFTFYILTEITPRGCVFVGYFSKEKNPSKNNNLSCILTLPSAQKKGYGKLLIDLSYQFSKREHKIGSPEHPLSDMGLIAYRNYWRSVIFAALRGRSGQQMQTVSIRELSIETAIHSYDIVSTLLANGMLRFRNDNYYIDIGKALNAPLPSLRRRFINPDLLQWDPPFEPNPYSKMNSYIVAG